MTAPKSKRAAETDPAPDRMTCCDIGRRDGDSDEGRAFHDGLIKGLSHVNGIGALCELLHGVLLCCGEDHDLIDLLVHHWGEFEDPVATFEVIRVFESWLISFEENVKPAREVKR